MQPLHRLNNLRILVLRAEDQRITALLSENIVDGLVNEPTFTARLLPVESLVRVSGRVEATDSNAGDLYPFKMVLTRLSRPQIECTARYRILSRPCLMTGKLLVLTVVVWGNRCGAYQAYATAFLTALLTAAYVSAAYAYHEA
jgi:hypothetical protein